MRIFSQAEIDWRAAHAPWNLRRDLKTNATWEAECVSAKVEAMSPGNTRVLAGDGYGWATKDRAALK